MNTPNAEEQDRLIIRMMDGEAGAEERDRFERLAETEPALWRELARAQADEAALRRALATAVAAADHVEIPADDGAPAPVGTHRRRFAAWALAGAGWAAAAALAIAWAVPAAVQLNEPAGRDVVPAARPSMTYEQLRHAYLTAPFVLDELDPIVLEVEELSDGRLAVRFMRRIEEVMFVDPGEMLSIDEEGALEQDPAMYRDRDSEAWSPRHE